MSFFRIIYLLFFLIFFSVTVSNAQISDSTLLNPWGKGSAKQDTVKKKDTLSANSNDRLLDTAIVANDTSKYFEDSSIEDLLNTPVLVASKEEDPVSDAPASVTIYTKNDMERLGYYNLGDLANITAGYSSLKTIGETSFETRGQMQSGFDNNKHLVLLDGIPVNHARANMALAEDNLNLFFAQRVEFLKGPGSALYGTSAFSGVINLVSQELTENGMKSETKFSLGNLDFKRRAMTNIMYKTDEGFSRVSATYFGKDATLDYLGNGMYPNANSLNRDNATDIFINAVHKLSTTKLKGSGVGMIYSRKVSGMGEFWMFQQNQDYSSNQLAWEMLIPYLKYERAISKKLSVNSYIKGNMSSENAVVGGYQQVVNNGTGSLLLTNYNIRVIDREVLAELRWKPNERTNIIAGFNMISRYSTGAPETFANYIYLTAGETFEPDTNFYKRSSTFNMYSGYLQYRYDLDFLNGTEFTIGARMDAGRVYEPKEGKVINKYQQISPRLCILQKVNDHLNLKLIYGKALRAPLVKEVGLNDEVRSRVLADPTLAANVGLIPELKPESISSYEAVLILKSKKVSFTSTVFYNETRDALGAQTFAALNNNRVYINNTGAIKAKGYELEVQFIPMRHWKFDLNYSRAKAKDPNGNDLANVPTGKLNGIITYQVKMPLVTSFTLVGHWVENYRTGLVSPYFVNNNFSTSNSLMSGYNVFDFNLVSKLSKNLSIELQIRNLLNSNIKTPSGIISTGLLNVPYAGRSFLGTIGFSF